jgi:hypothetical protein
MKRDEESDGVPVHVLDNVVFVTDFNWLLRLLHNSKEGGHCLQPGGHLCELFAQRKIRVRIEKELELIF